MNDFPRQKLCEIIKKYGHALCDEPRRCEAFLRDELRGEHSREIHLLVFALKERVPADLLNLQNNMTKPLLLARLSKRLYDNLGIAEEFARWAVESWALALGVMSAEEIRSIPPLPQTPESEAPAGPMGLVERMRRWFSKPSVSASSATAQKPPTTSTPTRAHTTPQFRSGSPQGGPVQVTERINPKDGAVMVYIPEGEFIMGTSDAQINTLSKQFPDWKYSWFNDEKPQHRVYLDSYWIYKHEVTVVQYRKFCQETGHKMPDAPLWRWLKDDLPIVDVTWYDAAVYSQWAGVELPTEAQWEKAARGTDDRIWPWGNQWDSSKCNTGLSVREITPVGSYPSGASPYGLMDMAGNVWELCMDEYDSSFYAKSPKNNPVAGGIISFVNNNFTNVIKYRHVLRGGWQVFGSAYGRVAGRYNCGPPTNSYGDVGFRCAGLVTP